jgi:hypothetical protein
MGYFLLAVVVSIIYDPGARTAGVRFLGYRSCFVERRGRNSRAAARPVLCWWLAGGSVECLIKIDGAKKCSSIQSCHGATAPFSKQTSKLRRENHGCTLTVRTLRLLLLLDRAEQGQISSCTWFSMDLSKRLAIHSSRTFFEGGSRDLLCNLFRQRYAFVTIQTCRHCAMLDLGLKPMTNGS